jgi:hypothetical protein
MNPKSDEKMDNLDIFYTKFKGTYKQFANEANRAHRLSKASIAFLDHLVDFFTSKTEEISEGSILYRATDNRQTPMTKQDFWPHDAFRGSGRVDKEDQLFLYMANSKTVCLYELKSNMDKPALAVATMKSNKKQTVAIMEKEMDMHSYFFPVEENEFHFLIATIFSQAVADSEPEKYRPTQAIATALHNAGIDGISFRSSKFSSNKSHLVDNEIPLNTVLFDRYAAEAISYEELKLPENACSDTELEVIAPSRTVA